MKNILVAFSLIYFSLVFQSCKNDNGEVIKPSTNNSVTTTGGVNTTTGENTTPGNNTGSIPDVVKLSVDILPIFNSYNCTSEGCHGGNSASGGVNLGGYNGIKIVASNGKLYKSISHSSGADPMPSSNQKMDDTELAIIKKWIDAGFPNN